MLDLGKVAVEFSAKLDQQTVIGELDRKLDRGAIGGGRQRGNRQIALRFGVAPDLTVAMQAAQRNSLWSL